MNPGERCTGGSLHCFFTFFIKGLNFFIKNKEKERIIITALDKFNLSFSTSSAKEIPLLMRPTQPWHLSKDSRDPTAAAKRS